MSVMNKLQTYIDMLSYYDVVNVLSLYVDVIEEQP
jgi:hypothetical protein